MKRNILFAVFIIIIVVSCSNVKEKDVKTIKDLELALLEKSKSGQDITKSSELVHAYIKYADDYPNDTASANYLFKAASISMNIKKYQLSIDLFDRIMKDYPTYSKMADCMFFKAFVYDNDLKNIKKARETYEAYLKKYPNHIWAKDVPGLLEMLGKTSEQIGAELKEKQKADSLAKE